MDPALFELPGGEDSAEIEAVIRLDPGAAPPPSVRIVAQFGEIATCRVRRDQIQAAHDDEAVVSLKAARILRSEPAIAERDWCTDGEPPDVRPTDRRRPPDLVASGKGIVLAVLDWGCDFAHPDFRRSDGGSRLLALWDQRGPGDSRSPAKYGYGRLYRTADIDAALASPRPYEALGYHPGDADPDGTGSHGTHVLSIAAGGGGNGGPLGMAPDADLVFVHLSTERTEARANLGDSVTMLEGLDFVDKLAGARPCVVNTSVGRCAGPHDGSTLVERAMDHVVSSRAGRCVVQSCGNYYEQHVHTGGRLLPGESHTLQWVVDPADVTPNELEVWYSMRDTFVVDVRGPGTAPVRLRPGERGPIVANGQEVGHAYHRACDPNNDRHHIDVFLRTGAPAGAWSVVLVGEDVVDGRFHAWVERDATCPGCQSHFEAGAATRTSTTGTICNGFRTIAVGAYNLHDPELPMGSFSSSGPTADGRQKPEVMAPGVSVLAARSAPPDAARPTCDYVRKSGTSMAAPYVAGTVACMFEAGGPSLTVREIRAALAETAVRPPRALPVGRTGAGYVDAVAAAGAVARRHERSKLRGGAMDQPGESATPMTSALRPAPPSATGALPPHDLPPAAVFDALALGRGYGVRESVEQQYDILGVPHQPLAAALQPGDVVVWRALGEGGLAGALTVASAETTDAAELAAMSRGSVRLAPGRYAFFENVVGGNRVLRHVVGPDGRLPVDRVVLRPRRLSREAAGADREAAAEARTCEPAPEPDPTGRGPHPMIMNGSRRPAVGHAQQCLNNFMEQRLSGSLTCPIQTAEVQQLLDTTVSHLRQNNQLPLVVDCVFGSNTDRMTRAFQACHGLDRDGRIGPITWPILDGFATRTAPPTPVTVDPLITTATTVVAVTKPHTSPPRVLVTLRTSAPFTASGTLTRASASPAPTVRLFTVATGGQPLTFDGRDNVFPGAVLSTGLQLFADAVGPSSAVDDFALTLTLQPQVGVTTGAPASARMTAVELTLDVALSRTAAGEGPPMSAADKVSTGRAVQVSDTTLSHERAMIIVRPPVPAAFAGTLVLEPVNPTVRLFQTERPGPGEAALAARHEVAAASVPATGLRLFAETTGASAAVRDTGVRIGIRDVVAEADRVAMTAIQLDVAATAAAGAPPLTFVRFGLWDQAYDAAHDLLNGVPDVQNFVGRDKRRFHVRVSDPAPSGSCTVNWKTLLADGLTDDDAPASQALTLPARAAGAHQFVSRAVMLVTDNTDRNVPTESGLAAPFDTGLRQANQSNHRTRRAKIDGSVRVEYAPQAGVSLRTTLPLFDRVNPERRRVSARVVRYTGGAAPAAAFHVATPAEIAIQFAHANARWNQVGIAIGAQVTTDRVIPPAALDGSGLYGGSANNAHEQAALADLIPVTPDDTLTVVFVSLSAANAYATTAPRNPIPQPAPNPALGLGERHFVFINTGLNPEDETLAHELHHVLFNRFDGGVDRQFFTFNTNPASNLGLAVPDARVYRRVHNRHSADPDNDPASDNVVNWARRQRTARFPIGGNVDPAATATTGNRLAQPF